MLPAQCLLYRAKDAILLLSERTVLSASK
jgi:hypothetical protein